MSTVLSSTHPHPRPARLRTARHRLTAAAVIAVAAAGLVGCGSSAGSAAPESSTSAVTMTDPWVKAVDSGMTAAFGTLANSSGGEVVLVSASTPASPEVQLHEMAMKDGEMVMQEKAGGIPVPAGGQAVLEPGGDHIMLMDVAAPIRPGDVVTLTLTFSDGSTTQVEAVAKEFTGADEDYDDGMDDMDGMEPSPSGS